MISRVGNVLTVHVLPFELTLLSSDLDTSHAAEIWAKYINRNTGRRSDAATGTHVSYMPCVHPSDCW